MEKQDVTLRERLIEEIQSHKIWKVLLVLAGSGLGFFLLGRFDWEATPHLALLAKVPFDSLGEELLKMLFLVGLFEVYLRRESEHSIQTLLFSKRVVSSMLDIRQVLEVMGACFARVIPNEQLAHDMVRIVQNKAVLPSRHHHNVEYDVTITKLPVTQADQISTKFFIVHLDIHYESKIDTEQLRFVLAHSNQIYNTYRNDPTVVWKWLQVVPPDLIRYADKVMRVRSCHVDGAPLREVPAKGVPGCVQQFDVPAELRDGQMHQHHYELSVMVRRNGHLMTLNIDHPTRNMRIAVDYGRTDIAYMNVVDSLTSAKPPEIRYAPDDAAPASAHRVSVQLRDDWILPKSTTAFVWRLEGE